MANLSRAERYKRNYRILRNTYNDTELARKARTWSDDRLYKELGVNVSNKKTPDLKYIAPKRDAYYKRKLDHFKYARSIGLSVNKAKKYRKYSKTRIKSSLTYNEQLSKPTNRTTREQRAKLWGAWSKDDNLPPDIEAYARKINRELGNDDYDKYGYVFSYYYFLEGGTLDDLDSAKNRRLADRIEKMVRPDPFDKYQVFYKQEVEIVS